VLLEKQGMAMRSFENAGDALHNLISGKIVHILAKCRGKRSSSKTAAGRVDYPV
jgi:hypothetical protein